LPIFVILVFEFRSFSRPIAILAATVLCGPGALLGLWMTGTTLNISSFMGAVMVVGIVHKNGVLMLDSEQYFPEKGYQLREAIFGAGRRRLRPILMTALATIFGMTPLAPGVGPGAGHIKTGSGCRSEREANFNQFLRVEDRLGAQAKFAGRAAFCRCPRFGAHFGRIEGIHVFNTEQVQLADYAGEVAGGVAGDALCDGID
jgi:hypothetical protein